MISGNFERVFQMDVHKKSDDLPDFPDDFEILVWPVTRFTGVISPPRTAPAKEKRLLKAFWNGWCVLKRSENVRNEWQIEKEIKSIGQ